MAKGTKIKQGQIFPCIQKPQNNTLINSTIFWNKMHMYWRMGHIHVKYMTFLLWASLLHNDAPSWVIQIDPLPIPTRSASAPASIRFLAWAAVTTTNEQRNKLNIIHCYHTCDWLVEEKLNEWWVFFLEWKIIFQMTDEFGLKQAIWLA